MKTVFNTSNHRTIIHDDAGTILNIPPGELKELPDDVAEAICASWDIARVESDDEAPTVPAEPWEKATPLYEKALAERDALLGGKPQKTVGPDRPPVVEPSVPKDDTTEKNVHLCPTCEKPFDTVRGCRLHQRKVHST